MKKSYAILLACLLFFSTFLYPNNTFAQANSTVLMKNGESYEFTNTGSKEETITTNARSKGKYDLIIYKKDGSTVSEDKVYYDTVPLAPGARAVFTVKELAANSSGLEFKASSANITSKKSAIPVFLDVDLKMGENYVFTNTSQYSCIIEVSSFMKGSYDCVIYKQDGTTQISLNKINDPIRVKPGEKAVITVKSFSPLNKSESLALWAPYACFTMTKSATPALGNVHLKVGESYEFINTSKNKHQIHVAAYMNANYSLVRYDKDGLVSGQLNVNANAIELRPGERAVITIKSFTELHKKDTLEFGIPYGCFVVNQSPHPALLDVNLKTGESYTFINTSEIECEIYTNAFINGKYDVTLYSSDGTSTEKLNIKDKFIRVKPNERAIVTVRSLDQNYKKDTLEFGAPFVYFNQFIPVVNKNTKTAGTEVVNRVAYREVRYLPETDELYIRADLDPLTGQIKEDEWPIVWVGVYDELKNEWYYSEFIDKNNEIMQPKSVGELTHIRKNVYEKYIPAASLPRNKKLDFMIFVDGYNTVKSAKLSEYALQITPLAPADWGVWYNWSQDRLEAVVNYIPSDETVKQPEFYLVMAGVDDDAVQLIEKYKMPETTNETIEGHKGKYYQSWSLDALNLSRGENYRFGIVAKGYEDQLPEDQMQLVSLGNPEIVQKKVTFDFKGKTLTVWALVEGVPSSYRVTMAIGGTTTYKMMPHIYTTVESSLAEAKLTVGINELALKIGNTYNIYIEVRDGNGKVIEYSTQPVTVILNEPKPEPKPQPKPELIPQKKEKTDEMITAEQDMNSINISYLVSEANGLIQFFDNKTGYHMTRIKEIVSSMPAEYISVDDTVNMRKREVIYRVVCALQNMEIQYKHADEFSKYIGDSVDVVLMDMVGLLAETEKARMLKSIKGTKFESTIVKLQGVITKNITKLTKAVTKNLDTKSAKLLTNVVNFMMGEAVAGAKDYAKEKMLDKARQFLPTIGRDGRGIVAEIVFHYQYEELFVNELVLMDRTASTYMVDMKKPFKENYKVAVNHIIKLMQEESEEYLDDLNWISFSNTLRSIGEDCAVCYSIIGKLSLVVGQPQIEKVFSAVEDVCESSSRICKVISLAQGLEALEENKNFLRWIVRTTFSEGNPWK